MTTKKKLLVCAGKGKCNSCTGMVRLGGMKWSLFPGSCWEIAGLGKPGQAKWNQVKNRKMEEGGHSCRGNRG